MKEQLALQTALRTRLDSIRIRYPQYSLRAFAGRAGLSPATLSLILKGKRKISRKLALQISEKLRFDPQERAEVLNRFLETPDTQKSEGYAQLTQDQYEIIADWRAFAILNLIGTHDFIYDVDWIADRLALKPDSVNEILQKLRRLGMVRENGVKLVRTQPKYRTTEDLANLALRESHHQSLDLAEKSLEQDSVTERDFTWVTFPMRLAKMELAKTLIRKFQDDLLALVEGAGELDEVYRFSTQLFPLSRRKDGKESK